MKEQAYPSHSPLADALLLCIMSPIALILSCASTTSFSNIVRTPAPSLKVEQTSQEGRVFSEDDRRAKENESERGMRGGRRWRTNSDERTQLSAITRMEKINCHAHDRRHCV